MFIMCITYTYVQLYKWRCGEAYDCPNASDVPVKNTDKNFTQNH